MKETQVLRIMSTIEFLLWGPLCVCVCVCVCVQLLSCVCHFVTPGTVAHQAPLSMKFSKQEYWSGCHFLFQMDLPNPGIEPGSPALVG